MSRIAMRLCWEIAPFFLACRWGLPLSSWQEILDSNRSSILQPSEIHHGSCITTCCSPMLWRGEGFYFDDGQFCVPEPRVAVDRIWLAPSQTGIPNRRPSSLLDCTSALQAICFVVVAVGELPCWLTPYKKVPTSRGRGFWH